MQCECWLSDRQRLFLIYATIYYCINAASCQGQGFIGKIASELISYLQEVSKLPFLNILGYSLYDSQDVTKCHLPNATFEMPIAEVNDVCKILFIRFYWV